MLAFCYKQNGLCKIRHQLFKNSRCLLLYIPLSVAQNFVARGFPKRRAMKFMQITMVFHADGRENLGHAEMGENKKRMGSEKRNPSSANNTIFIQRSGDKNQ